MAMTKKEALQLVPLNGHVLVKDNARIEKTKGGIYIPDTDKTHTITQVGVVLRSSNIRLKNGNTVPPEVLPGDEVLYNFLAGIKGMSEKGEDGTFYRIIENNAIIAKICIKKEEE